MTVNETLYNSEDIKEKIKTFNVVGTMSFSCGVDAKNNGYQSKEATFDEVRAGNSLPPTPEYGIAVMGQNTGR